MLIVHEEGYVALVQTIALMHERAHLVVLPAVLLACVVDNRADNECTVVPVVIYCLELNGHGLGVENDIELASDALEVVAAFHEGEGIVGRSDEATVSFAAAVDALQTCEVDTGAAVAVGQVGAVLYLNACAICTVGILCHVEEFGVVCIGYLVAVSIEQVALNIETTTYILAVFNTLIILQSFLIGQVTVEYMLDNLFVNIPIDLLQIWVCLSILVALIYTPLREVVQFLVDVAANLYGIELVVQLLQGCKLRVNIVGILNLCQQVLDVVDVAQAKRYLCHFLLKFSVIASIASWLLPR